MSDVVIDRRITLIKGWYHYDFSIQVDPSSGIAVVDTYVNRNLYLTDGSYDWECDLYPKQGYYYAGCFLTLGTSGTPAAIYTGQWNVPSTGPYYMEGSLEWYKS
jgi:hypothetical protein